MTSKEISCSLRGIAISYTPEATLGAYDKSYAEDRSYNAFMVEQRTCPDCSSAIPINKGFVTWCECGWNLAPSTPREPSTLLDTLYCRLGERSGQSLFDEMMADSSLKSQWSLEKILALALAATVYLMILVCFVTGIWLIYGVLVGMFFFPMLLVSALLLGFGALGVVLPQKLERTALARDRFPELYALVDRTVRAAGGQRSVLIAIDSSFNANMGRYGWEQIPVMTLGLPLWFALEPLERVALIGHEIGHSVNGDNLRYTFFWSAVQTLSQWQRVFHPEYLSPNENPLYGLLRLPFYPLLLGLSGLAWLWLQILGTLSFRDSQRAEYLADAVSAQCGGTQAALNLQWKLLLSPICDEVTQRIALERSEGFFELFEQMRKNVPAREFERLRLVSALSGTRLDHTHPLNAFRQQILQKSSVNVPAVNLEPSQIAALEREISTLKPIIEKEVLSRHRDSMYYG